MAKRAKHRQAKGKNTRRRGRPARERPLTAQQQRFCEEVAKGKDSQKQCAIGAGYSARTAEKIASQLLDNPRVSSLVAELRAKAAEAAGVEAAEVVREWARIGFSDLRDILTVEHGHVVVKDSKEWSDDAARAVAEITETTTEHGGSLKVKLHKKQGGLDSLGKYLGLLIERKKHEHSGPGGGPIVTSPIDLSGLDEDDLRQLHAILAKAANASGG